MTLEPKNSIQPKTRAEWRVWLEENHAKLKGVWLITYKKSSGLQELTYEEAVQEAVCFGWIDSKGNKLDDQRTMLWYSPRKPGAGWSKSNKERVERLLAEGLIAPAGLAKIEAAKNDGSWTALDDVEARIIPPDLEKAFTDFPNSKENFGKFPSSTRRTILLWISTAKTAGTRAKRIEETARLAQNNIRVKP